MKKLWIAHLELDTIVYAEDEAAARKVLARLHPLREALGDLSERDDARVYPLDHIPGLWEEGDIPYGAGTDGVTLGELLKGQPEYQAAVAKARR